MKHELVVRLHADFERIVKTSAETGVEFWMARDLQTLLGYPQWRNFEQVIEKAMAACENSAQTPADHFAKVGKMIDLVKGALKLVRLSDKL